MKRLILITLLLLQTPKLGIAEQSPPSDPQAVLPKKQMLGWIENVKVYPGDLLMHAKISPASEGHALHATDIEEFKVDGKRWVRFTLKDRKGKTVVVERPSLRKISIRKSNGTVIKRYAVMLGMCLGNTFMQDEVTLADRSGFEEEILIGRSFLAGKVTIDPALTYTTKPKCKKAAEKWTESQE